MSRPPNIAQHPLFARTGWCSDRTDKEHHPGGVVKEASRHFLGDAATPPRGDARRGIRFFQNDTSKPHIVFLAALESVFVRTFDSHRFADAVAVAAL